MLTRTQIDALKTIVVQKNRMTNDYTRRVLWYLIENSECGTKNISIVLEQGSGDHQFRAADVVMIELYLAKLMNEAIYLNTLCELAGTHLRFDVLEYEDTNGQKHKAFALRDTDRELFPPRFVTYQELAKVDLDIPEALRRKK